MTKLTSDQINQLNMYSVYVEKPQQPLFTFEDVLDPLQIDPILHTVQSISNSPNRTVAASFFLRRFGLFISMQFYQLAVYEEIWQGVPNHLLFGEKHEHGTQTVSLFVREQDWIEIAEDQHKQAIEMILHEQCQPIIQQVRTVTNISARTLWENIFGYLLWHYHVLLENPVTEEKAREDLNLLKNDSLWKGISKTSLFANYLKGSEPSALLNTPVRTTCCFSKDVPGLMQCGFCPLK